MALTPISCAYLHFLCRSSKLLNPLPGLDKITAPMVWVNSADDFINPPELKIPESVLPGLKTVTYRLIRLRPTRAATAPTPGRSSGGMIWSGC
jgi:hypothetical protein